MIDANRLRAMGTELIRVADELDRADFGTAPTNEIAAASTIRDVIRARRMRERLIQTNLFADPAWDLLLELYASQIEGREISVSAACNASAVPPTTALRWIGTLTAEGLVERVPDVADGRRVYLKLTDAGWEAVSRCFAAQAAAGLPIA